MPTYFTPVPGVPFARTNAQTIAQRAALLRELLPDTRSIAEICCGNCQTQRDTYRDVLGVTHYCGLDLAPALVELNRTHGIECVCGDALDLNVMRSFMAFEVVFFGPPLSVDCDGHHGLPFRDIVPSYADFARLLLADLHYAGTFVCIGPRTTTLGDARQLYVVIKRWRSDFGLRLIHHSYSTVTGDGSVTEPRLKYVEFWFSNRLADAWEVRISHASSTQPMIR